MAFKTNREKWTYELEGRLIFDGKRILVHSSGHNIPLLEWLQSWNFKDGDEVIIGIERKFEK
jgi:hypothetical protein